MRTTIAIAVALPLVAGPLLLAPSAQAASTVKIGRLERTIERGLKQQAKVDATVKCPKKVTWVKGKVFYCKVSTSSGNARARVRLGSPTTGKLNWKIIT